MTTPDVVFAKLMSIDGMAGISNEKAFARIGSLIDLSADLALGHGTTRALEWCDALEARGITPAESALLDYFRANAWATRQEAARDGEGPKWGWQTATMQNQIFHLRRARNGSGFSQLDVLRRCQIHTNLGNALSQVGRFIEAQEAWTSALQIDPNFWMASGNRGRGLVAYARALYDGGNAGAFLVFAHRDLVRATTKNEGVEYVGDGPARAYFTLQQEWIEKRIDVSAASASLSLDGHSLGRSKSEQAYRRWCLRKKLFLNPLNDLGPYSLAARDFLSLPSFRTDIHEPPVLIGFFNQLKQEFASARWEFYEGRDGDKVHFSDRGVRLINTLDYPAYGLGIEKMKVAFRLAYSLLDKVAFFLNRYMKLEMSEKSVYFRRIWREKSGDEMHPIRSDWLQSENWAFHGLFWLSKDLFDGAMLPALDPDARSLSELRNHLEHKYVKVHEMLLSPGTRPENDIFYDDFAYSISRTALEERTLRLLKLARAALIYLSLGMHREEQRRHDGEKDVLVGSMSLEAVRDDWKR